MDVWIATLGLTHHLNGVDNILALANHLIDWVMTSHPDPNVRTALSVPHIVPVPEDDPQQNPPDDPEAIKFITTKYTPADELEAVVKSIKSYVDSFVESPIEEQPTIAVLVPRNARGVEVVVVHLVSRAELTLGVERAVAVDPEDASLRRPLSRAAHRAYDASFGEFRRTMRNRWLATGARYVEITDDQPPADAVRTLVRAAIGTGAIA